MYVLDEVKSVKRRIGVEEMFSRQRCKRVEALLVLRNLSVWRSRSKRSMTLRQSGAPKERLACRRRKGQDAALF